MSNDEINSKHEYQEKRRRSIIRHPFELRHSDFVIGNPRDLPLGSKFQMIKALHNICEH